VNRGVRPDLDVLAIVHFDRESARKQERAGRPPGTIMRVELADVEEMQTRENGRAIR
jgi:hypothetical protein